MNDFLAIRPLIAMLVILGMALLVIRVS